MLIQPQFICSSNKNNNKWSSVTTYRWVETGSNSSRGSCRTKLALLSFSSKILTPTANGAHLTSRHCMLIKSRGAYSSQKREKKRKTWKETGRANERKKRGRKGRGFYSIQMFSIVETASLDQW